VSARWVSLIVVVVALAGYHVAQRAMPIELRPAPLFMLVYGVATVLMVVATLVDPGSGTGALRASASHWAPWLLVAAVSGIELGVYAMYRSGWSVSVATTSTQAIVAVVLGLVGVLAFGEHITMPRVAGIGLCVVGAALVTR
jgi:drug/metabolite transporter (DMT)-like permease